MSDFAKMEVIITKFGDPVKAIDNALLRLIYDLTGSYNGAFICAVACFVLSGVVFWIAAPRKAEKLRAKL